MKVYTGGGDKGQTSLFSGERVAKHHARIEVYGNLDELNSCLGLVAAGVPQEEEQIRADLVGMQSNLFLMGAWLATMPGSSAVKHLTELPLSLVTDLEKRIDVISEALPELRTFILPGGGREAAWAHVVRTVCRRCERSLTRLIEETRAEEGGETLVRIQVYLNRMSDYLFVLARYLNHISGTEDTAWKR
ncbi:MAG: cob(I)yrinic acid a,c-diamide adenosyltransferase [Desulfobulbus sp.]